MHYCRQAVVQVLLCAITTNYSARAAARFASMVMVTLLSSPHGYDAALAVFQTERRKPALRLQPVLSEFSNCPKSLSDCFQSLSLYQALILRLKSNARVESVLSHSTLLAYREENAGSDPSRDKINHLRQGRPESLHYFDFMACCALPSYEPKFRSIQGGISCAGCQLAVEEDLIPFHDAAEKRDIVYSREGFIQHFELCKDAQLLWTSSTNGQVEPPKLPYACKVRSCPGLQEQIRLSGGNRDQSGFRNSKLGNIS